MSMDYKRRLFINRLAEAVIDAFDIKIPIDNIEEVVTKIGGAVKRDETLSEFSDGLIMKTSSDQFSIFISPYQPDTRKNFTIAHELGHLFLHMGYKIDSELWNQQDTAYYRRGTSEQEYEANEFAAAFLMPQKYYLDAMRKNTCKNAVNTAQIAQYFHVSVYAASNRGKWLGYLEW